MGKGFCPCGQGKGQYTNLNVDAFFAAACCSSVGAGRRLVSGGRHGPHDAGTHVRGCAEALVPSNVS
jgi:hypothetical protein